MMNKTMIYKLIIFYFFELSEKFVENEKLKDVLGV